MLSGSGSSKSPLYDSSLGSVDHTSSDTKMKENELGSDMDAQIIDG